MRQEQTWTGELTEQPARLRGRHVDVLIELGLFLPLPLLVLLARLPSFTICRTTVIERGKSRLAILQEYKSKRAKSIP